MRNISLMMAMAAVSATGLTSPVQAPRVAPNVPVEPWREPGRGKIRLPGGYTPPSKRNARKKKSIRSQQKTGRRAARKRR